MLTQRDNEGNEYVIAYASRSCNKTERNYSSYHGECLAAVWAVSHFRYYLYGRKFTLITDHEPLEWLMTNEKLRGMHARWANILQEYDIYIKHRSGVKNLDADGLSRNPLPSEVDLTGARIDHVQPEELRLSHTTQDASWRPGATSEKGIEALDSLTAMPKEGLAKASMLPSVDTPSALATLLARTDCQQWTPKSTGSSQGRPIQSEVYPFHHAFRHMHAGSKSRDLDPGTTSQVVSHSVPRLSTRDLPTTGRVVEHKAYASRQLTSRVSADISPLDYANQPHEAQDQHAAHDLYVKQEVRSHLEDLPRKLLCKLTLCQNHPKQSQT